MAYAVKRIYQGQLSATLSTVLATVPGGKTWIVNDIEVANTDTSDRLVTLSMPGSGVGAQIFPAVVVAAGTLFQWTGHIVLAATETVCGGADVTNKVTVTISGAEGP